MPGREIGRIAAEDYIASFESLEHVFLVGNLKRPGPHPFFRDSRLEVILCQYSPGGHGIFHWHPEVTEFEYVLEGTVLYREAATGRTTVYGPGDLATVPAQVCVERRIEVPTRTLAIKVPSNDTKVHCPQCPRECSFKESS